MTKVALFEVIRKAHLLHGKSVRKIACEQGVHRRLVRQALQSAQPPARKAYSGTGIKLTASIN